MKLTKTFATLLSLAALTVSTVSCDSTIFDNEGDCESRYEVKFKYIHHLKYGDAFPYEVASVNLYVFDRSERLVRSFSEPVTQENAENFSIRLTDLPVGDYTLLAWCGVKDNPAFTVNPDSRGNETGRTPDYTCRINRDDNGDIYRNLLHMFHGKKTITIADDPGDHVIPMELIKNTNIFRIVLQHQGDQTMDPKNFKFDISDDNGHMGSDNKLLADSRVTYHAFEIEGASAQLKFPETQIAAVAQDPELTADRPATTVINAVAAEISVGRLLDSNNAVLRVTEISTGKVIFSLPAIDLALMTKAFDGYSMSDNEFLDRQDRYTMTFLLDDQNNWTTKQIHINKWFVVYNNSTLH